MTAIATNIAIFNTKPFLKNSSSDFSGGLRILTKVTIKLEVSLTNFCDEIFENTHLENTITRHIDKFHSSPGRLIFVVSQNAKTAKTATAQPSGIAVPL